MEQPGTEERRRSAFAAAGFSLLFPGLGHAYLGYWSRALAWAALPILALALVGGLVAAPGTRDRLLEVVLTDAALTGILIILAIDLVYRLLCMVDAWRLARSGDRHDAVPGALGSVAGLLVVVLVLAVSHVAVARPVLVAMGTLGDLEGPDEEMTGSFDPDLIASFRPVTPPPTPTADPSNPVEPTATPEPTPTQGPAWDEGGRLTILLVGADGGRAGYDGYLTDTLIVVTVDTRTKQSAFISIPRDMQGLPIPRSWPAYGVYGGTYSLPVNTIFTAARINPSLWAPEQDKGKGFAAIEGVLEELYGLHIDYYVAVDLRSFREVIDTLGGTIIDVQNPVYDYHYPADDGRLGHMKIYVPPGIQYMNGTEALAYARARKLTSDFDRAARQQRVVTSVREQLDLSELLAPGVIGELLSTVRSSIRTDVPPSKLPKLAQLGQEVDLDQRVSLVLTPPYYGTECYLQPSCPNDYRLVADVGRIRAAVRDVFKADREEAKLRERLIDEGAVVHVLNGTRGSNARATKVADALADLGMDAVVPPIAGGAADRDDYERAVVIAWNGAGESMPVAAGVLTDSFGVKLVEQDDPLAVADFTVIVGSGTTPPG
jgi:polyisoprenyl-teichoic acid--peptidoglycan teichoic acid transferase